MQEIRYRTIPHSWAFRPYYEERYRQRVLTNLQRRVKAFGYVLQEVAKPEAGGVS